MAPRMLSVVYKGVISTVDPFVPIKLQPFWSHPAGPKTVHFWGPCVKWGLVIAGLGDINRPVQKLSLYQATALATTGSIWARYCLVIIPKNYYLCSVNVFVALTGFYQLARIAKNSLDKKAEEKHDIDGE